MPRNYVAMRKLLGMAANLDTPANFADLRCFTPHDALQPEIERLSCDGLLDCSMEFDGFGAYLGGEISGLTREGSEFYRLVENGDAWAIILKTLDDAEIDVPYPLLKEVCEEIVKRYVVSFIPEI